MPAKQGYTESQTAAGSPAAGTGCETQSSRIHGRPEPRLQNLIPLAVAIAAGCEPCAEAAVTRALKQGSSMNHVGETLHIIAYMQGLECLMRNVGPEVVARMSKPLAAASRTLQQAAVAEQKQTG